MFSCSEFTTVCPLVQVAERLQWRIHVSFVIRLILFSYRHAFHAANHADVLKHSILLYTLDHFNQKDAPYWVIDTHAGAGIYDLTDEWASKNSEHESGLDRLLGAEPAPMIERYLDAIEQFNPDGTARFYPGSPWLALNLLRQKDRLRLFELHPTEFRNLNDNIASLEPQEQKKIQTLERDGFAGLKALLPPPTRRAVTLIDPSYEDKTDYRKTLSCLQEALKRFPTGCYLIWYPLIQRREATELVRALERLQDVNWLNVSLTVRKPPRDGLGLHGSGVFVVNPPWTLPKTLKSTMPWLSETLGQDKFATFTLRSYEAQKQPSKGAQKRSPSGK